MNARPIRAVTAVLGVLLAGACDQPQPASPQHLAERAQIERACLKSGLDTPTRCVCVARAVASAGSALLTRYVVAQLEGDIAGLERMERLMTRAEFDQLMANDSKVSRTVMLRCGPKRAAG